MSISLRSIATLATLGLCLAAGCSTVDLGQAPVAPGTCQPDPAYYRNTIWPQYLDPSDQNVSCVAKAGCHRSQDGRSALRLLTGNPLSAADQSTNYNVVTKFLNCGSPQSSALLTKPESGANPHAGGDLFGPGSKPETVFLKWFKQ